MKAEEIVQKLRDSDYCENMPDCEFCRLREAKRCASTYDGRYADGADMIENLMREIKALAQANATKRDELERYRWIPVEEALPKSMACVLGRAMSGTKSEIHECYVDDGGYWHSLALYGNPKVTHWMKMPEFEEE